MRGSYTVALVGFAQNESATFESFFRLAARRPPSYRVQDEVIDAQILIVNADNPQALHLVRHADLPGRVLLVGNSDGGTGWPLQRKPVKLVAVLAELDGIVGGRPAAPPVAASPVRQAAEDQHAPPVQPRQGGDRSFAQTEPYQSRQAPLLTPAMAPRRRAKDTEFPPTRPMTHGDAVAARRPPPAPPPVPVRPAAPAQRPGVMGVTDFGGLEDLPLPGARSNPSRSDSASGKSPTSGSKAPAVPEVQRGDVLLVAESLVEGRILLKRFKKYNLNVDWSREATQAVVMLKAHPYRLVVVDRLSGEPDAFQVCRTAKQQKQLGKPPVVIMFAAVAGSMDRMKAGLAGSDAYLSRSVAESDLYKVLSQHRLVNLEGFQKTSVGF
jgi:CheY-like chemotaxis protein